MTPRDSQPRCAECDSGAHRMSLADTASMLTYASIIDHRKVEPEHVFAWHEVLGHLDVTLARQAIIQHRRESTEYLMPAHVIRGAQRLRAASRAIESPPECPRHSGYILSRLVATCAACEREREQA